MRAVRTWLLRRMRPLANDKIVGWRWHRTFLCELANLEQPLGSVIARDCCLPLEPTILDQKSPGAMLESAVAVHDLTSTLVGGFGRTAQAAWLLDGVLQGLSMVNTDQKLAHLIECDRLLQSFLAIMMQQHGGNFGAFCTPIALTIRYVPSSLPPFLLISSLTAI